MPGAPHLTLTYRVVSELPGSTVRLVPAQLELAGFTCRLEGDLLVATTEYDVSQVGAEEILATALERWALRVELDTRQRLGFRLQSVSGPAPRNGAVVEVTRDAALRPPASPEVALRLEQLEPGYLVTEDALAAAARLRRVEDGFEPVTSAAWWLVKFVEALGGQDAIMERLNVSDTLLELIGDLGTHPDASGWLNTSSHPTSLGSGDVAWLLRAMRELVRRLAAAESGIACTPTLTLETVP